MCGLDFLADQALLFGRCTPVVWIQRHSQQPKLRLYIMSIQIPLNSPRCSGARITTDSLARPFSLFSSLERISPLMLSLTARTFKTTCKNTTSQCANTWPEEYMKQGIWKMNA